MSKIELQLIKAIEKAVIKAFPDFSKDILQDVYLEIPKEMKFGDFSANFAMRMSKLIKKPPMEIAQLLDREIRSVVPQDIISDIKIEKPGFINFYLSNTAVIDTFKDILAQGDRFGSISLGKGKKAQIEFVSANPTGPLTVAHGRQAAVGDSLARVLQFCGYRVTREYYVNDEGVQITLLGKSVRARFNEIIGEAFDFPENGYKGEYIYDIARDIIDRYKGNVISSDEFFTDYAYKQIMGTIKKDLEDFGVKFDVWYSQRTLSKSGKIKKALKILKDKGFLYEEAGATWFKSTEFGDDKDRVVIKNDKSFTYLAPDIAYHKEKFKKGYKWLINIWGPDHHGYISRLKAACQALGYDKDALSILISQLVTLYRNNKPVRMSTREGEFITLRQVIDEVGKDAGRFFFLMRRTDSHLDFDLELAKSKTMDNPVYYIQYAYARICSILKFSGNAKEDLQNLRLLDNPAEIDIIKHLMQYPKIIESTCLNLEPYTLLSYLQSLAGLFHSYYGAHRIVTEDALVTKARITLVKGIKTVLFSGLTLLGISAPNKM